MNWLYLLLAGMWQLGAFLSTHIAARMANAGHSHGVVVCLALAAGQQGVAAWMLYKGIYAARQVPRP